MGNPKSPNAVPAGHRTRKVASSPLESRLRDYVAHHEKTGPLYRRGAELVDLQTIQDCRGTSLWRAGGKWVVAAVDTWASQAHIFDEEGPALDKHIRLARQLAAKAPHQVSTRAKTKGNTTK
jgi:hypothetical protein